MRSKCMAAKKKTPAWETIAIFAAIFALWPAVFRYWAGNSDTMTMQDLPLASVLHWDSPVWDVVMCAALAVMIVIAVRRVLRLRSTDDGPSAQ